MKGHFCPSCNRREGLFYKQYRVEKGVAEKGPFYMCEDERCDRFIPFRSTKAYTWTKKLPVASIFDVVIE